ncbi:MAG: diacylglyceryl transferase, partial [Bacteroidota bacterium]|nr:diacylglyceryl transferase [Bacteroidota bacterium]
MLLRCYPKITDWIFHAFNQSPMADYRFLPIYSYGFFVACGFFAAATLAVAEMRRREALGLLKGQEVEIKNDETPGIIELLVTFVLTFTLFYKLIGIFVYHEQLRTYQLQFKSYLVAATDGNIIHKILSIYTYGSWVGGLLVAVSFTAFFFRKSSLTISLMGWQGYAKKKELQARAVMKKVMVYPSDSMGDLVVIAAIFGVLGSCFFNFLENPDDYKNFWSDPVGSLFSGLSVYGGLIMAGIGFGVYAWRKKFNLGHFFDSVAPGFMLANGLGRLGCQVAGDGDWGIANLAAKPSWIPQFLWSTHYEH